MYDCQKVKIVFFLMITAVWANATGNECNECVKRSKMQKNKKYFRLSAIFITLSLIATTIKIMDRYKYCLKTACYVEKKYCNYHFFSINSLMLTFNNSSSNVDVLLIKGLAAQWGISARCFVAGFLSITYNIYCFSYALTEILFRKIESNSNESDQNHLNELNESAI
jgi:hypothetical protein